MEFTSYKIVPLQDEANPRQCAERNAQFWGLYGITSDGDAFAIGDFSDRTSAELIRDAILAS